MSDVLLSVPSLPRPDERIVEAVEGILADLHPDALMAPVTEALTALDDAVEDLTHADVDVLTTDLPAVFDHLRGLLAPATLEHLEAAAASYDTARDVLADHPLLSAISAGDSVREAGLRILDSLVEELRGRVEQLVPAILPPDTIDRLTAVLELLERFAVEPPGDGELLAFLADNLVGVGIDVLDEAATRAAEAAAAVAPLERALEVDAPLTEARAELSGSLESLAEAVDGLDPTAAEAYERLEARIDDTETAIHAVDDHLAAVYDEVAEAVEDSDGPALLRALQEALEAVPLEPVITLDDVVDALTSVLEEVADGVQDVVRPEELRWRAEALSDGLRAAFEASPLSQVAEVLEGFAEDIREVVASVPVAGLQATLGDLVTRAGAQLDALGLDEVETTLARVFDALHTAASEQLDADALASATRDALSELTGQIEALRITESLAELREVLERAGRTVASIGEDAVEELARLTDLLAELEPFDVAAASDQVIDEIDAVRARLDEIDPPALSEAERLAIVAALAVLRELDLHSDVLEPLRRRLDDASRPVLDLLREITTRLERLRDRVVALAPDEVIGRAAASLQDIADTVESISAERLLEPAHRQVDALEEQLRAVDPGPLLTPLEPPFAVVSDAVGRLDPEHWLRPAADAWSQVDRTVDRLDVTPLLDALDDRRREAVADLRSALLGTFDAADLPEPVAGLLDVLGPVMEQVTGALLDEPERLREVAGQVWAEVRLDGLFQPVEDVFEQIAALARSIPEDALADAANTIRTRLGAGSEAVSPAAVMGRLRSGDGQLAGLTPDVALGAALALPEVDRRFAEAAANAPDELREQVAAVAARLDDLQQLTEDDRPDSLRARLESQHETVASVLRAYVDRLDPTQAAEAHTRVGTELRRLVPEFLRAPEPLTGVEVLEGLYGMRPSSQVQRATEAAERLAWELTRLQLSVRPAVDELFDTVAELIRRASPAALRRAVEGIYRAVQDTVAALDPDALTDDLRAELFAPLSAALAAVDPAALRDRLEEDFDAALSALAQGAGAVLGTVAEVADEELSALHTEVTGLLGELVEAAEEMDQTLEAVVGQFDGAEIVALVERLEASMSSINEDFDREFARVQRAFSQMLAAIPL